MNLSIDIRKKVTLVSCFIECIILGGVAYGWPSLVFVLRDLGYFSDQCPNNTTKLGDNVGVNDSSVEPLGMEGYPTCAEQDARLQLVFIIGVFGTNTGALVFGPVFDKFGTRLSRIISSILILMGCLMFAFSRPSTSYLTFAALHLLAAGGAIILFTSSQVGNLFGNYRSTVITLNAGAVVSSAIVMLFVQIAYTRGISMMASFCFLAGVTMFFNINTFILLPKYNIPWPLPENWRNAAVVSVRCGTEDSQENELIVLNESQSNDRHMANNTSWVDAEYQSLFGCLKSPMLLLFLMWFSILQLTNLFFIGTLNPRLQQLTNDNNDKISTYTTTYTALHSLVVLFSFFCGLVIDRNKKKVTNARGANQRTSLDDLQDSVLALLLTNMFMAAFTICTMIPVLEVQFLTFILQIIGRAFLFGIMNSFLTIAFPARYFGSIFGVCRVIAALFALLQYPLFSMVQWLFDENPFYADLLLFVLNICILAQPLYVYNFVRKKKRINMNVESE